MIHPPIAFAGNPLDRVAALRKDARWVEARRGDARAELLVLWRGAVLHERTEQGSRLLPLTMDALAECGGGEPVLLGLRGDVPVWAVEAGALPTEPFADLGAWASLRGLAPHLPPEELAVAGQAHWLLDWHRRHAFCARTGEPTRMAEGGGKRVADPSGTEHFPRTDPVAIVLPTHEDAVCLGRGPHFPPGFLSAFAGFMEPGETLEECGARELAEEAGLTAASMTYRLSQPWPFPASLMVGFEAAVTGRDLTLDPVEIEEARWLTREEARTVLAGEHEVTAPPPLAIAHHLLKGWVER